MKIIDRYLLKEMLAPFFTGILVFTFFLLMSQFLRLVELIVNKGVPVGTAGRLMAFLLPSILVMTVPMASLLGVLVAYGRLSADSEVTALYSSGVSIFRLARPMFFFSLAGCLLTMYLIGTALPAANQAFRNLMFEVARGKAFLGLRERVFDDDFDGLIIYVNEIPVAADPLMKGIIIHDYRGELETPPREPATIFAESGRLLNDAAGQGVIFRLQSGSIHAPKKDPRRYDQINFDLHDLHLAMAQEITGPANLPKGFREMTIAELRAKATELKSLGVNALAPQVEIHKKYAVPVACLIFGFLGLSLGIIFRKGEKMVSFALCLLIMVVYYIFIVAGEPMGRQGIVPPWISMWSANIFFSLLAGGFFFLATYEGIPILWREPAPREKAA